MKETFLLGSAAALALSITGFGQTAVSTTTTTQSVGTISDFSPDSIVIRS